MTLRKYKALVIEDEDAIRADLVEELNSSTEIEVIGEATSISTAYQLIYSTPADVIFLDIRIIEGNSLDLIKLLKNTNIQIPPIVITTGYKDFDDAELILNELREEVILMLIKPFWKNWPIHKVKILTSLGRHIQSSQSNTLVPEDEQPLTLPDNRQLIHVLPSEIISVKTGAKRQGKTIVIHSSATFDCNQTLAQLKEKLPDYFIQISRFEIINSRMVSIYKQADKELVMKNGYRTIVGHTYHLDLLGFLTDRKNQ